MLGLGIDADVLSCFDIFFVDRSKTRSSENWSQLRVAVLLSPGTVSLRSRSSNKRGTSCRDERSGYNRTERKKSFFVNTLSLEIRVVDYNRRKILSPSIRTWILGNRVVLLLS